MLSINDLTFYYGGVVEVVKETAVLRGDDVDIFEKGRQMNITPGVLFMIATQKFPIENLKLVLRQVRQLSANELIKLSEIAAPREYNGRDQIRFAQLKINTKTQHYYWSVSVSPAKQFILDKDCNMACFEQHIEFGKEVTRAYPIENQSKAFRWLRLKHIDSKNLIQTNDALPREDWSETGYAKDASGQL